MIASVPSSEHRVDANGQKLLLANHIHIVTTLKSHLFWLTLHRHISTWTPVRPVEFETAKEPLLDAKIRSCYAGVVVSSMAPDTCWMQCEHRCCFFMQNLTQELHGCILQAIGIAPMLRYRCSLMYLLTLQKGKTDEPHGISWCAVALCQNPSLVPRMSMGVDGSFYQRQFQNLKNQQSWSLRIIHNDNPLKLKPGASLAALLSVPATFIVDLVPWCTCILCLFSVCVFVTYFCARFSYIFDNFMITLMLYDAICLGILWLLHSCFEAMTEPAVASSDATNIRPGPMAWLRSWKYSLVLEGSWGLMVDARRDKSGLSCPLSLMFGRLSVTLIGPWLLEMVTIGLSMVWHSESAGQASRCRKCGNGQLWDTCGTILDNDRLCCWILPRGDIDVHHWIDSTTSIINDTLSCLIYLSLHITAAPTIYDDVIRHQSSCPQRGCKECWANICQGRKHWITGAGKLGQDLACLGNLCEKIQRYSKILRYSDVSWFVIYISWLVLHDPTTWKGLWPICFVL